MQMLLNLLFVMVSLCSAISIEGTLRRPASRSEARVSVIDTKTGLLESFPFAEGRFTFEIPATTASLLLEVADGEYTYSPVLVEIEDGTPQAFSLSAGRKLPQSPGPIVFRPETKSQHFVQHEGFNVLSLLKQPMVLMMVVFGGMALLMSTMTKNMSPCFPNILNSLISALCRP